MTEDSGLFDKIILAVRLQKELRQARTILVLFVLILLVSIAAAPFSVSFFISQWKTSGVGYFISTAVTNAHVSLDIWQDYALSILESLPVWAILLFMVNAALLVFSVRLFLYKKGLLIKYITHGYPR